jgi:deoxycytidine triphosphate deaminase
MELLSGKDAATHVTGILHAKYQVHGFSVHLTVRKIYSIDQAGQLDFGGSEYAPAGRVELTPHSLRPEDKYRWWNLDRQSYFVVCNETLRLAPDQIALVEPEDRLLRAGGWHIPFFLRGHVDPVELMLVVGVAQLRVKENARLAHVRLFHIDDMEKPARNSHKKNSSRHSKTKRK